MKNFRLPFVYSSDQKYRNSTNESRSFLCYHLFQNKNMINKTILLILVLLEDSTYLKEKSDWLVIKFEIREIN